MYILKQVRCAYVCVLDAPADVVFSAMFVAVSEVLRSCSEIFQPHEDPPYLKCNVFAGLQWEIALVHLGHVVTDVLLKLLAGVRSFLNEYLLSDTMCDVTVQMW